MIRAPEFAGIHLLYLDSKIVALRVTALMLFLLLTLTAGFALSQGRQVEKMLYDIEEGNSVVCEEGYISKIVEDTRVICIMQRTAPGALTYRQAVGRKR